jgi:hypothetical protein
VTAAEITALRKEFEDAILTACNNFKTKTGVSVYRIYVDTVTFHSLSGGKETHINKVDIELGSL